jgi:hypothetical protein
MPKDPTKNVDSYKIKGGDLNEFDFHQNQEELSAKPQKRGANLIPGTPPERKPAKKTATKTRVATRSTKTIENAKKSGTRKATKK